jgi:sRNA-binding carbon storage regulator CsrA
VLEIRANRVRIGIEAPFDVPIFREELRALQAETSTGNKVPG